MYVLFLIVIKSFCDYNLQYNYICMDTVDAVYRYLYHCKKNDYYHDTYSSYTIYSDVYIMIKFLPVESGVIGMTEHRYSVAICTAIYSCMMPFVIA